VHHGGLGEPLGLEVKMVVKNKTSGQACGMVTKLMSEFEPAGDRSPMHAPPSNEGSGKAMYLKKNKTNTSEFWREL
jgi:hypothetical protein